MTFEASINGVNKKQDSEWKSAERKPFEVISADWVKYASVAKYLNDTVENHLD